jgi:hypothetical protein
MKKWFFILLLIALLSRSFYNQANAQCALCKANAETSLKDGNDTAKGINIGIMYLLVIPYVMIGGIGYWWYVKNKKHKADS